MSADRRRRPGAGWSDAGAKVLFEGGNHGFTANSTITADGALEATPDVSDTWINDATRTEPGA